MSTNLDKNLIIVKTIKKVVITLITLIGFSLFIGCEDEHQLEPIDFVLNTGLNQDVNGYYHLPLDTSKWQTIHRISGNLYRNEKPMNITEMGWSSNFYWKIGDEFGYYICNTGLTDYGLYVGYDTTYMTWFEGFEVPIVNSSSYSNMDGEVNTMLTPTKTMVGDTATIYYGYLDGWTYEETYGEFYVIFD